MKIHLIAEKLNENEFEVTTVFGQFRVHKGSHINSLQNFRAFVGYDRKHKVYVGSIAGSINCSKMINMKPMEYRLEIETNSGTFGYFSSSTINVSEEVFEMIKNNGQRILGCKGNKEMYMIDTVNDYLFNS